MKTNDAASVIFGAPVIAAIGAGFVWGWVGLVWALISIGLFYAVMGIAAGAWEAINKDEAK